MYCNYLSILLKTFRFYHVAPLCPVIQERFSLFESPSLPNIRSEDEKGGRDTGKSLIPKNKAGKRRDEKGEEKTAKKKESVGFRADS